MEISKNMICHMLELNYIQEQGYDYPLPEDVELFPFGWFSMDYDMKIDILTEAIKAKIKIVDTAKYLYFIEGVKQ